MGDGGYTEPRATNEVGVCFYSEQKNRFTKGQNLLVSQITAQGTKVKACEFYKTKIDTLSFATPKYRTLVPAIGFIYILQWGTHNESVFFAHIEIGSDHTYHRRKP